MFQNNTPFQGINVPASLSTITKSTIFAWTSSPEELFFISQALAIAVDHHFMSPEHGAKIWKRTLSNSGFDLPKSEPQKERNNDDTKTNNW